MKSRDFLRSSTLRIGAYTCGVLILALFVLSLFWYQQARSIAEQDMNGTLNSYRQQLGEGLEQYGGAYGEEFVARALADIDAYVMLGIKRDNTITGNVQDNFFAQAPETRKTWVISEETLLQDGELLPVRLYRYRYSDSTSVIIGYDLSRFADMRALLLRTLIVTMAVSLLLAALLTAVLLWLVSVRLRPVNRACNRVMQGNLSLRLPAYGSGDQFDQLAGNFNAMLDWIEALLKTSTETADSLAHDLRAPLSRVRLQLAELVGMSSAAPDIRDRARSALNDIDRLVRMFEGVLTISRADAGVQRDRFSPTDLRALIQDIVELYNPLAEDKGCTLSLNAADAPIIIPGDRALLAQAISNLVDNAIKYAGGSAIDVAVLKTATAIEISVSDHGLGIPADQHSRVFERFVRLDAARSSPGFGLGLSFVAAIAHLHRGQVTLEDNQPGLRVRVILPL